MTELFEKAVEVFGTTERTSDAGYVLPNGALLNFEPFIEYVDGIKVYHHDNVKVLFDGDLPPGEASYRFTHAGSVRIAQNGVAISNDIELSKNQYNFIESYCVTNNGYFFVEFDTETDFLPDTLYYPDPDPEEVIRDIRRHYELL